MLESAEKNIQSAKQLLRETMGTRSPVAPVTERVRVLTDGGSGGRIIEGVFDGQNMMGPDGKKYPVPANYASKSKLVEGDVLKLTIADDGSFIYKQIGPVERAKKIGLVSQTENGEYRVISDGKPYKVLLASLTYFKAEPGDEVTIVVPQVQEGEWAALENLVGKGSVSSPAPESGEFASEVLQDVDKSQDQDNDLDKDLELGE